MIDYVLIGIGIIIIILLIILVVKNSSNSNNEANMTERLGRFEVKMMILINLIIKSNPDLT